MSKDADQGSLELDTKAAENLNETEIEDIAELEEIELSHNPFDSPHLTEAERKELKILEEELETLEDSNFISRYNFSIFFSNIVEKFKNMANTIWEKHIVQIIAKKTSESIDSYRLAKNTELKNLNQQAHQKAQTDLSNGRDNLINELNNSNNADINYWQNRLQQLQESIQNIYNQTQAANLQNLQAICEQNDKYVQAEAIKISNELRIKIHAAEQTLVINLIKYISQIHKSGKEISSSAIDEYLSYCQTQLVNQLVTIHNKDLQECSSLSFNLDIIDSFEEFYLQKNQLEQIIQDDLIKRLVQIVQDSSGNITQNKLTFLFTLLNKASCPDAIKSAIKESILKPYIENGGEISDNNKSLLSKLLNIPEHKKFAIDIYFEIAKNGEKISESVLQNLAFKASNHNQERNIRVQSINIIIKHIEAGFQINDIIAHEFVKALVDFDRFLLISRLLADYSSKYDNLSLSSELENLIVTAHKSSNEAVQVAVYKNLNKIIENGTQPSTFLVRSCIKQLQESRISNLDSLLALNKILQACFKSSMESYDLGPQDMKVVEEIFKSTESQEIKNNMVYIIGHYAGREIYYNDSYQAVIEYIKEGNLDKNSIFALSKIAAHKKVSLPQDIQNKLLQIALHDNNDKLRINALESIYHLVDCLVLPKRLSDLLEDNNSRIQLVALSLCEKHLKIKKDLPASIQRAISQNIIGDAYLERAMNLFLDVKKNGCDLTNEVIDLLAWVLCEAEAIMLREMAYKALKSCCKQDNFDELHIKLLEIEKIISSIDLEGDFEKVQSYLKIVDEYITEGVKPTKNYIYLLNKILQIESSELYETTLDSIENIIKYMPNIPLELLDNIVSILEKDIENQRLVKIFIQMVGKQENNFEQ